MPARYIVLDALSSFYLPGKAYSIICFAKAVPLIFPYLITHNFSSGFHLPLAAFAVAIKSFIASISLNDHANSNRSSLLNTFARRSNVLIVGLLLPGFSRRW